MPWDRTDPHDLLADHVEGRDGTGHRAVVVGAGYGADAEHLASLGYETTAFDISPAAVDRGPASATRTARSTTGSPTCSTCPRTCVGAFDLVVEIYTVQALHGSLREGAVSGVRRLVAPGGTLFVVQIVRDDDEEVGPEPPWLLDRAEMAALAGDGLVAESLDRLPNPDRPEARDRWRMVLTRR